MLDVLVKLMLVAGLAQIGMSIYDVRNCISRECLMMLERRSRDVLNVDWKPIEVWPEEGGGLGEHSFYKVDSA